jgi:cell division protease FtsH
VPEHDPVYKVSIIPRGRALGVTMFLPEEDRYSTAAGALLTSMICSLFGGRIAEELTLGKDGVTTGASQRYPARHRDRAQHGHQVGSVGAHGSVDV